MSTWTRSINAIRADPRGLLFVLVAAWIVAGAWRLPAVAYGDGGEYHLTAESFVRHLTPDVRPGDVTALAGRDRRLRAGVEMATVLEAYFESRGGAWYAIHFWGYSLVTAPARALLRVAGANDLKNALITNAALFLLALHQVLFAAGLPVRSALLLGLLVAFSPAVWFVQWTHPEAFCFALVLLALVWAGAGHRHRPVMAAALAAMQNPGLVWLVGPLWLRACRRSDGAGWDPRQMPRATLAALPAVLPALFSLAAFGVPSLIARETTRLHNLSAGRTSALFLDPNLGLLGYAPVTVGLFAVAVVLAVRRARASGIVLATTAAALLAAATCTVTETWNHGTAGPSRYAVWLAAFVFFVVARTDAALPQDGARSVRFLWTGGAALAVAAQAAIVFVRGGLAQPPEHERHSHAARLVLQHAPALYSPDPAVFVARTSGDPHATTDQPAIYRDAGGCRKAWVRPRDRALLERVCGGLPPASRPFFEREEGRKAFAYVHY